jgi:hypothetical protein
VSTIFNTSALIIGVGLIALVAVVVVGGLSITNLLDSDTLIPVIFTVITVGMVLVLGIVILSRVSGAIC